MYQLTSSYMMVHFNMASTLWCVLTLVVEDD